MLRGGSSFRRRMEMEMLHLLVLNLLTLTGVQSESSEYGVKYPEPICAVRGLNVRIPCTYFYPASFKTETVLWCSMKTNKGRCTDPPYIYDSSFNRTSEGFEYIGNKTSNCTLLISNVQLNHSTEYKFRFSNKDNQINFTGDSGVTVKVEALQLTGSSGNGTLKEGDSVNLTCAVNCSLNSTQFVWFKNNQLVPSSSSSSSSSSSILHLPAVTVEDSGNYSCALKSEGNARSEEYSINVEGGPQPGLVFVVIIVVGILVLLAVIILAIFCNRRKKKQTQEESAGGISKKTQANQVTQPAESQPQEEEVTYVSVHKTPTKPKGKKEKPREENNDGRTGRKTQVGGSVPSDRMQEDDVTYASVIIKPNKPKESVISTVHLEEDDSVIYSAVATK